MVGNGISSSINSMNGVLEPFLNGRGVTWATGVTINPRKKWFDKPTYNMVLGGSSHDFKSPNWVVGPRPNGLNGWHGYSTPRKF